MRTKKYNGDDERTPYCEIFVSIFKAFGNTIQKLTYAWCEKKAKDSDYIWLATNNFTREKGNVKLLDGIGSLTITDLNYLIIESSGVSYNITTGTSHILNDTLKNIKTAFDNLKAFISHYKQASFNTLKQVRLYTCQIIENKMTLVRYKIKSLSQWQVVECCSASVPTTFSEAINYNICCVMGHDITVANFYNSVPILDPNSFKASYILWDTISRLQAVKKGNYSDNKEGDATKCVDKLSFRNLAPWLENKKATISERFSQISMYLRLASSIIAVTFSRQVVSVSFKNFVHQDGLSSRTNLVDIVGVPQLYSYASTEYLYDGSDVDGPPSGFEIIGIPHFHPGTDKHTTRAANGSRRVIDVV